MADFLAFVRRRRDELLKELRDLEAAERVFLASDKTDKAVTMGLTTNYEARRKQNYTRTKEPYSIKEMVRILLEEQIPDGLTAQEILGEIKIRWNPNLERTSLSPQLSRLKRAGEIFGRSGKWYLSSS